MPRNSSNYLKIPQNAPKYVLQDYRGISERALVPPIPEALLVTVLDNTGVLDQETIVFHQERTIVTMLRYAPRQAVRAASTAFSQQAAPAVGSSVAAQALTARWMSAAAPGPKVRLF